MNFESSLAFRLDFSPKRFYTFYTMSTHRKSVAFSDEHTIVASNGEVTEVNGTGTPDKTSAESHSVGESAAGPHVL